MAGMTRGDVDALNMFVKAGRIDDARALLEGLEGEKAANALKRLNERYPSAIKASQPVKPVRNELSPELRLDGMDEIKQAIREKRYADADALLVLSDHPDAEKLRTRLFQIRGSQGVAVALPAARNPLDMGSTVRRVIIAFLVLAVIGVGGTLFVLQQKEKAERPEKIYDQLFAVCWYLAGRNAHYDTADKDILGQACDYTAQDFMRAHPSTAEYCYMQSGGGTYEWFGCDLETELNLEYLAIALNS